MTKKGLALLSLLFLTSCQLGGGPTGPSSDTPKEDTPTDQKDDDKPGGEETKPGENEGEKPGQDEGGDTPGGGGEEEQPKEVDFVPEVGEVRLLFETGKAGETLIYNYCPSIFIENGVEHVYFCSNQVEGNVTDYVGYRRGVIKDNKVEFSNETQFVLSHGSNGSWDYRHACDPSVIKGEFKFHGENYSYLMAYLGCVPSNCTRNETGIAVSKTPVGPWVKCDFKQDGVTKINPIVPYSDFQCSDSSWGTGQPSIFSVDKKGRVIMCTTVGATNGTFTNVREYDFSDIDNYQLIRERLSVKTDGIKGTGTGASMINNGDFGYDYEKKRVILAKPRQFQGLDGKSPDFIADTIDVYYLDDTEGTGVGDVLFAGNNSAKTWKSIGEINQNLTGFLRNHNTGLITDEYGGIDSSKGRVGVAFTRSDEGTSSNWSYLSTYRIYATAFNFPKKY